MASVHKHIRSGTASKRPTTAIAEGQIALATNITSPGLFFKDSTGATIVKIGPVHVGTTAPNATPAGSAGNSIGEVWLDTSLTPVGVKIYNGTAFVNATPIGSTTVEGLLELATDAETQTGSDTARAVTSAGLQSKLSDSTSTTSATTIASSTAVKAAFDLANLALPKTGGTVTGNLEIGTVGSLSFEGATADGFETTIAVVDPTADRTITLPNITGTVVTTGDTGTVTSTMLLDGTILNEDINASAAIAYSKLATLSSANIVLGSSANVATSTAVTGDVTIGNTGVTAIAAGVIVNADVNASAAIAGTKIAPDFGAQTITTTGVISPALGTAALPSLTFTGDLNTGIFSPGADQVAISTNGVERVKFGTTTTEVVFNDTGVDYDFRIEGDTNANLFFVDASTDRVGIGTSTPGQKLDVNGEIVCSPNTAGKNTFQFTTQAANDASLLMRADTTIKVNIQANGTSYFNGGNVGIGTTTPVNRLTTDITTPTSSYDGINLVRGGSATSVGLFFAGSSYSYGTGLASGDAWLYSSTQPISIMADGASSTIKFSTGGNSERARIDSSGRLLVGTSTSPTVGIPASAFFVVQGYPAVPTGDSLISLQRGQAPASITSGAQLGGISFGANDGSPYAQIHAATDGAGAVNDYPGRLVFSTTSDSASSPTERMRITSGGNLLIGGTLPSSPNAEIKSSGLITSGGFPITRSFSFLKYAAHSYVSQVLNINTEINAKLLTGSSAWRQATVTLRGFDGGSVGYWHGIYSNDDGGVRATELASTGNVTLTVNGGNLTFVGSVVGQWYNTVLTISYTAI